MRVSDAERADITDRLARHYGEGRLDMAEFDERVTRAMAAKTVGDFQGIFDDLPDLPGSPAGTLASTASPAGASPAASRRARDRGARARRPRPRGRRGLTRTVLMAVLVIVAAAIAWHAVTNWIAPLMWLAILAAIIVIVSRVRRR